MEIGEDITLDGLIKNFQGRYQRSLDKETLLERETLGYEAIFDNEKFPLDGENTYEGDFKLKKKYGIDFSDGDVFFLRQVYYYFIAGGNDLAEAGKWLKDNFFPKSENSIDTFYISGIHYINVAKALFEYLGWLKNLSGKKSKSIVQEEYLGLVFNHFKDYFPEESKKTWISRFCYPDSIPVEPIAIDRDSKDQSNKLVLLGILCSIQGEIRKSVDFNIFVRLRFGLKGYQTLKTRYWLKPTAQKSFEECNKIIENARL